MLDLRGATVLNADNVLRFQQGIYVNVMIFLYVSSHFRNVFPLCFFSFCPSYIRLQS